MDSTTSLVKLEETLKELLRQRAAIAKDGAAIDQAIAHVEKAVDAVRGAGLNVANAPLRISRAAKAKVAGVGAGSHLENVIKVLEASGKPMHIVDIAKQIAQDKPATRASIDGAVSRHIRESKTPRIARLNAGIYGLTSWPQGNGYSEQLERTKTRADLLIEHIAEHGPSARRDLLEATKMPLGSLTTALNDKRRFQRSPDGLWDVVKPAASSAPNN